MRVSSRTTIVAAIAGGLAWIVKSAVITVRSDNFQPLESVFFLGGLLGIVVAVVGVTTLVTRGASTAWRVATGAGILAGSVAASLAVTGVVAVLYDGSNIGLNEEAGIFAAGLAWLVAGLVLAVRGREFAVRRPAAR